MFTVLATGDNHFDEYSQRWQETLRVHRGIVEQARARRPSLIAITGDLNERRSTARERLAEADFLVSCAEVAPVVVVAGNHDHEQELALYASLRSKHPIVVVEDARVVEAAGVIIACVAWPKRAGAIDDGTAREQVRSVLRGLGQWNPGLLVGHFDVDGAKSGAGQPVIGGSIRLGLADLGLVGAQATLMGHIHAPQDWTFNGAPIIYCGSPVRHDYGETEAKSFVWLEVDGDHVRFERISTDARPMLLGEADWDDDGPGWTWRDDQTPLTMLSREDIAGADVRFRYHVRADQQVVARTFAASLRANLLDAGAERVTTEPVPEVATRAREGALAVTAARSLDQKLDLYWAAKGDVPVPAVATRLKSRVHDLEQGAKTP